MRWIEILRFTQDDVKGRAKDMNEQNTDQNQKPKIPNKRTLFFARYIILILVGGMISLLLFIYYMRSKTMDSYIDPSSFETMIIYKQFVFPKFRVVNNNDPKPIPQVSLGKEITKRIFKDVRYEKKSVTIDKGGYLSTVTLQDGSTKDIALSVYGGFFIIRDQRGGYQTEGHSREVLKIIMDDLRINDFAPIDQNSIGKIIRLMP